MSSVIFQPLLHDPLGWKASNTTYADAFKWKKYRATTKDKKISAYGQQYQRQMEKRRQQQQQQQSTPSLLPAANEEETIERVNLVKKNEDYRAPSAASHRQPSSKTPPLVVVVEEAPILVVEYKQRPTSTNREASSGSRTSQRSSAAVEETTSRPATSLEARRSPKEDKDKVYVDPNNDNSRHWLTYPNPKTPQYLIDIKQRLGQLKIPSTLARAASVVNTSVERPESSVSQRPRQPSADERHFLDFNLPDTPADLRAARHRLEKHRYNSSLDNYPPRPQTCPERSNEKSKPLTPPPVPHATESEDEQSSNVQTTVTKDNAWIPEDENQPTETEAPLILVQSIDVEGVPSEYVEALEIANVAQDEYLKNFKLNGDKKPDQCVYRLPSRSSDEKNDSLVAYRNQQQQSPLPPKTSSSSRQNNFGAWVRNATDRERESAMKILHDVLQQPVLGYDIPKQQTVFKQAPAPTSVRTSSATRKLGRTRTHQRMPCEICEKQLIKHHVWNLSRSDTLLCPHQAQGMKPPLIDVRA